MTDKKSNRKSFATLAQDLRKIRARKPTSKQIDDLNSAINDQQKKPSDRRKSARPPEREI